MAFEGGPLSVVTRGLAGSPVNIAVRSLPGTSVATATSYINRQVQQTLQGAGPIGSLLSEASRGVVSQAFSLITGASVVPATNYKMFPGGGNAGEVKADYGGSSYTLDDVVFSLQPASQGPQAFGDAQSFSLPKSLTTLPFNQLTSMPTPAGSATANQLKKSAMVGGLAKKAFSSNLSFGF